MYHLPLTPPSTPVLIENYDTSEDEEDLTEEEIFIENDKKQEGNDENDSDKKVHTEKTEKNEAHAEANGSNPSQFHQKSATNEPTKDAGDQKESQE